MKLRYCKLPNRITERTRVPFVPQGKLCKGRPACRQAGAQRTEACLHIKFRFAFAEATAKAGR